MRHFQLGLLAGSLTAAVCVFLAGCGGPVDRDDEPLVKKRSKGGSTGGPGPAAAALKPIKGDPKGVLKGVVKWQGARPNTDEATAKLRETISKNNDSKLCLAGSELETTQQAYRIGKNGNLGNVFVWIAAPSGHYFEVPDDQLPKTKEVLISQPHCAFVPHCATVFAARYKNGALDTTGCQVLVVQNDAPVAHNASMQGGPINGARNELLPAWSGSGDTRRAVFNLRPERDAVRISCGVHGWMSAFVRVFDHPYHAISSVGADLKDPKKPVWENLDAPEVGTFEITGMPVGAKVKLFAWHEDLGHLKGSSGEDFTVKDGVNEVTIEAKAK